MASPGDIACIEGLRSAMGITLEPVADEDDNNSQVGVTSMSGEEQSSQDMDDEGGNLQTFFDQGPDLHVCASPSVGEPTAMDTS